MREEGGGMKEKKATNLQPVLLPALRPLPSDYYFPLAPL
jgi:hypothetical protein